MFNMPSQLTVEGKTVGNMNPNFLHGDIRYSGKTELMPCLI